jgi:hypothetical protein
MLVFFWIVGVMLYLAIGGGMGGYAQKVLGHSDYWSHPGPFFTTILWPIVLPAWVGLQGSKYLSSESRTERRRDREIEEANHRVRLAKLQAQENAELDRMLK